MKSGQRPVFAAPDFEDQRDGKFLMVWGDLPYWTVVDAELRRLLSSFDGTATLGEVCGSLAGWRQRREARKAVELLASRGVVTVGAEGTAEANIGSNGRIENIAVNVTRRCNLRCRFCYNLDCLVTSPAEELDLAEIVSVLDASKPFWGKEVALSILGGEPLLAEAKTLGLIQYARENRMIPILSTNGTRVSSAFARQAAQAPAEVQVSIDGAREETNDRVRGKGSFVQAVQGVKTLVEAGAHTIISMVCHKGNFDELGEYYELGLRLGANEVRFIPLKRMGGTDTSGFAPVPLDELVSSAISLFREHPEYRRLTGRDALSIIASSCRYAAKRVSCGTGLQTFLLDANGDIYPCLNTNTRHLRVANVRAPGFSFAETWQESPVLRDVRHATNVTAERNACRKCAVRHWCLGGCRGETLATRGDLRLNAWNCDEQKRALIETMWALSETPNIARLAQAREL